jgi:hypothetical protein
MSKPLMTLKTDQCERILSVGLAPAAVARRQEDDVGSVRHGRVQPGVNVKIFLNFRRKFWEKFLLGEEQNVGWADFDLARTCPVLNSFLGFS